MAENLKEFPNEELILAAEQNRRKRRRRKIIRVVVTWIFAVCIAAVLITAAVLAFMAAGKNSLRQKNGNGRPVFTQEETIQAEENKNSEGTAAPMNWQEGWVRHNGRIYEYKEDILTFLVMGIDKAGEVEESAKAYDGGQADAIFLAVLDPSDKSIRVIAINRDTMTDVQMIDENGVVSTIRAQIATQHGFGDGLQESCELTKDAVSNLFYELPIHGYVSINMEAIGDLNDAVGGVELTVPEDLTEISPKWIKGAVVNLKGDEAFWYVKYRDITVFESNRGRLARQKQYLTAFAEKAIEATEKDLTFPVELYNRLSKYMVTDITADEVAYLTAQMMGYHFSQDAIYTLEGTTLMGKRHEEFYYDEAALKDLMIQIFYEEVVQ